MWSIGRLAPPGVAGVGAEPGTKAGDVYDGCRPARLLLPVFDSAQIGK